jgi:hypothetical protein
MVFQIKNKAEIFKIPNFGGIPNIYFGKILHQRRSLQPISNNNLFSGLPRHRARHSKPNYRLMVPHRKRPWVHSPQIRVRRGWRGYRGRDDIQRWDWTDSDCKGRGYILLSSWEYDYFLDRFLRGCLEVWS